MQNLKHLYYEIPNFTFTVKEKRTKLQAALSPLSQNLAENFHQKIISIELLTGKNLPNTLHMINNNLHPSMIGKSMVCIFCYTFRKYGYLFVQSDIY